MQDFSACGICHCDPRKIHDHAFAISALAVDERNLTAAVEWAVNIKKKKTRRHLPAFQPQIGCLFHLPAPVLLLLLHATRLPYPTGEENEPTRSQKADCSGSDWLQRICQPLSNKCRVNKSAQQNEEKRQNLLFACTDESLHKNDVADSNMNDNDDDDDDFCVGCDKYFYAKDGQKWD